MKARRIPMIVVWQLVLVLVPVLLHWVGFAGATLSRDRKSPEPGESVFLNAIAEKHTEINTKGAPAQGEASSSSPRRAPSSPLIHVDKSSVLINEESLIKGAIINVDNRSGFDQTLGIDLPQKGFVYSQIIRNPEQIKVHREEWARFLLPTNSGVFILVIPDRDPAQLEKLEGKEIAIKVYQANELRETIRIPVRVDPDLMARSTRSSMATEGLAAKQKTGIRRGPAPPTGAADIRSRPPSILVETEDVGSGWKWIANQSFGFAIRVPTSSRITEQRVESGHEYVRTEGHIKSGKYLLEMFLVDQSQKKSWTDPCPGRILNFDLKSKNGLKIFTGDLEDESADSPGWWWRALCVESDLFSIWMQAAERNSDTPIVKKIFGSFRFIPREK